MFLVHQSALSALPAVAAELLLLQFSQSASKVWRKSETSAADLKCFHAEFGILMTGSVQSGDLSDGPIFF
ncbi:unnamed protein product [Sphagnum jensenii]|uniref:Secreted protein n=1 Tax=Sphagnum jensenii TaxID=128206 RepID=A0ABP1BJT3_9BRYO